jgi:hypothetical protein
VNADTFILFGSFLFLAALVRWLRSDKHWVFIRK